MRYAFRVLIESLVVRVVLTCRGPAQSRLGLGVQAGALTRRTRWDERVSSTAIDA